MFGARIIFLGILNELSGMGHANKRVFVYNQSLFQMYSNCEKSPMMKLNPKHNVDYLFASTLVEQAQELAGYISFTSNPDDAALFVIPVMCSLSANRRCGDHLNNTHDLLSKITYLKKGKRDHFIICDSWVTEATRNVLPKEIIIGTFEGCCEDNYVSVGYSTVPAVEKLLMRKSQAELSFDQLHYAPVKLTERKWKAMFVGKADTRIAYKYRILLKNQTMTRLEDSVFIKIGEGNAGIKSHYFFWLMSQSLMVLSLPGDTSTTDRIFNAFETGTLIAVLSHDKERLLSVLPNHHNVPWESILIFIDSEEFVRDPIGSIVTAVGSISEVEVSQKAALMEIARDHVIWTYSRVTITRDILQNALRATRHMTDTHVREA